MLAKLQHRRQIITYLAFVMFAVLVVSLSGCGSTKPVAQSTPRPSASSSAPGPDQHKLGREVVSKPHATQSKPAVEVTKPAPKVTVTPKGTPEAKVTREVKKPRACGVDQVRLNGRCVYKPGNGQLQGSIGCRDKTIPRSTCEKYGFHYGPKVTKHRRAPQNGSQCRPGDESHYSVCANHESWVDGQVQYGCQQGYITGPQCSGYTPEANDPPSSGSNIPDHLDRATCERLSGFWDNGRCIAD